MARSGSPAAWGMEGLTGLIRAIVISQQLQHEAEAKLVLAACPAMASTYYVGTCHAKSFPTISAAVSAVPADSIIDVCPGTHSEQVIISKSLTLQGIPSQNNGISQVCCAPGNVAVSQVLGLDLIPAVWVTAGTVNILEMVVTSNSSVGSGCPQLPTGIFYASGTAGTVNHSLTGTARTRCYGDVTPTTNRSHILNFGTGELPISRGTWGQERRI